MLVTVKVLGGAEHTLDVSKTHNLVLRISKINYTGGGGYSSDSG